MKRICCFLFIIVVLSYTLSGCGNAFDPTGEYEYLGIESAITRMLVFRNTSEPYIPDLEPTASIKIAPREEGYSFTDTTYKGTAAFEGELFVFNREEAANEKLKDIYGKVLEEHPDWRRDAYYVYKNYLISANSTLAVYYGNVPKEGYSHFGVKTDSSFRNFSLDFFDDGSCEFEGKNISSEEFLAKEFFAEGEYEMDGQIINVTLKNFQFEDSEIKSCKLKYAFFVSEGKVYDQVYKKMN